MTKGPILAAALLVLSLEPAAFAQEASARDRLIDLTTIEVGHELCGFELTDEQEDALTAAKNKLVDDGEVPSEDIAGVHDQLSAAMARQVPEGLCRAGGPGERLYKQKLEGLH